MRTRASIADLPTIGNRAQVSHAQREQAIMHRDRGGEIHDATTPRRGDPRATDRLTITALATANIDPSSCTTRDPRADPRPLRSTHQSSFAARARQAPPPGRCSPP